MIRADNLHKSFADHILFDEASFSINKGERVGLVGRNGYGKTTLFRMICGEEKPSYGNIVVPKNYQIGYVKQQLRFSKETIMEEGMTRLPATEKNHFWKVGKILSGLGFSDADMQRHPNEFSGGYQVRLNLAKELVAEPDLLLLDEPTNYLDITSIRWIEQFLLKWPHELMLITHDRTFMDKVVTHVLGIHRKKMRKIPGTTEKYYGQLAQDEEIYEKTRVNDEKRRKEIEQFITRFRAKARLANLVQSRIKTLSKMEKKEKLEKIKTLDFSLRSKSFPGKQMMNVSNICFSYDANTNDLQKYLINKFSINIGCGECICVVGKNGKGKTTLLKLFAEAFSPQKGKITFNPNVVKGFFEQTNVSSLIDQRTV
ncbi:MAG: ATP-binding cassette domain-containing protein, partial [Thermodesulfobacteriota bacterium]|nr:ATP-binding cassette domain-containing protein [Thermodesulfobacteriota bacterium]